MGTQFQDQGAENEKSYKKWYKKWWGITLIVLAGFWAIGLVAPSSPDSSEAVPATTTTTYYSAPETTTTTEAPAPDLTEVGLQVLYSKVPAMDVGNDELILSLLSSICGVLDSNDGDFIATGTAIVETGSEFDLTYSDAGAILIVAINLKCPEYKSAAEAFIATNS